MTVYLRKYVNIPINLKYTNDLEVLEKVNNWFKKYISIDVNFSNLQIIKEYGIYYIEFDFFINEFIKNEDVNNLINDFSKYLSKITIYNYLKK
ncbi:MAG: hypothetical protein LBM96_13180 [Methanobrevibacter sp.]|jgi:hypothetical protein|nr:hypothetical protein [Candidatus Methanoflexus mossambicus]